MSNLGNYAKQELEILEKSDLGDSVILPFKKEIMSLVDAFSNSGQSGGSAPYVATSIARAINKLLLFEPLLDIQGISEEWCDDPISEDGTKQNKRCFGLFKYSNDECKYIDAIIFKGQEKYDTFTGSGIYVDETLSKKVGSSQSIKGFPFKPKTFYLDVEYFPINKNLAEEKQISYIENNDGKCYYSVLKDIKQLRAVKKYYDLQLID